MRYLALGQKRRQFIEGLGQGGERMMPTTIDRLEEERDGHMDVDDGKGRLFFTGYCCCCHCHSNINSTSVVAAPCPGFL